ncbi:MAG: exopolysaccharide biosynthesis protein [Acidobacteria bacterium]|nr:exopolysaccharide biosynthesis protein [Acidobacteriota bacterium]
MVDIHCHILPGLDDGPDTLEESVAMAEQAIAEGVTHLVATPHSSNRFRFDAELVARRREELQEKVGERLHLATGCDFHLNIENLREIEVHPDKFTIHQKNYLLVEFADFAIPPAIDHSLARLQADGIFPIITHPERNGIIRSQPSRLEDWLQQGCFVQVTAGSFLGRFGSEAKRFSENLLDSGAIHFLASDAHNTKSRPIKLKEVYKTVSQRKGETVAKALLRENPLAAFEGRPLPYVPDFGEFGATAQRKRFFFF